MVTIEAKEAAVQKLAAAGDDLTLLVTALNDSLFLDDIPGDHRQKFRAAKTRYRKLKQEADAAAAEQNDLPDEDITQFDDLGASYSSLNWRLESKPGGATIKPDVFYKLYSLYMQATQGDNDTERPMWGESGGIDFDGREKWDAWTALKGTPRESAKQSFVNLYHRFDSKALFKDTRSRIKKNARSQ